MLSCPFRFLAALVLACVGLCPARATLPILSGTGTGADTYGLAGDAYAQDFDTLPAAAFTWTNTTTLPGWHAAPGTGTLNASALVANGGSNVAHLALASVGVTGDPERALAYHTRLASVPVYLGLGFVNQSDRELLSFSLAYTPEQWRENTNARTITVEVHYRVGATASDLASPAGWTVLPGMGFSTLNGSVGASAPRAAEAVPVSVPAGQTLWFRWVFTNSAASDTSSHDLLAIDNVTFSAAAAELDAPPTFLRHPGSRLIAVGEPVTFSAEAAGRPAPSYQWMRGTEPIPGATSATHTIASVQLADAGDYHVVAANSLASVPSQIATLTVSPTPLPPRIFTPPAAVTINLGEPFQLGVEAGGSSPLAYQWYRDDVLLPGATSATLSVAAASAGDAGAYRVTVTNPADSVESDPVAVVVVIPPAVVTPPAAVSAPLGQPASLAVAASGTAPLTYQWFKDGQPVPDAVSATLAFAALAASDAGLYSVSVGNAAGVVQSAAVGLVVILPPAPPAIVTPPASRSAVLGGMASFSVVASGTAPLSYAWLKDGVPLPGSPDAPVLQLVALTPADAGAYRVVVTNALGFATSVVATLEVSASPPPSAFGVRGFAQATTGGGLPAETDPNYRKVYNAADFRAALSSRTTKVIEIMNDLDLGWNEIPASERTGRFRSNAAPKLHPVLLASGVTTIDIQDFTDLTIFSASGAAIRHAEFNVKRCHNLIIRNLRFDELWEWDETSKGDYDSNDWDFITVDIASTRVWIDHCDFSKAYDGVVDVKSGSNQVTISWCRFLEDDGGPQSWVRRQIEALESSRSSHAMYNFLRSNGFSVEDIIAVVRSQKKGHLVGANNFDASNANLSLTLHHNLYVGMQDRLPRLRGGNAHSFNLVVDNRNAVAARAIYDARVAAMSASNALKLSNGSYKFGVTQNGAISTEGGAVLLEKSVFEGVRYALRNNQTDVTNPAYTGRIRGEDVIFRFGSVDFRGGSDQAGHPLGPTQAPQILPFSWNGFTTLPYAYTPDDPEALPALLAVGAGAGTLAWEKTNWLKTAYPAGDRFPAVLSSPASVTLAAGASHTFSVMVEGVPAPGYQWLLDGEPITGAVAPVLALTDLAPDDVGAYSVRVTNSYGSVVSAPALLTLADPPASGFAAWAAARGLAGPDAAFDADTDRDGLPLLVEYALGLDPASPDASSAAIPALQRTAGGELVFRFTRSLAAADVVLSVETTDALDAAWTATAVAPVIESETGTTRTLAFTFPAPVRALFVRLRAQPAP